MTRFPRLWSRPPRTPLLMQLEPPDCGAACLGIVLAHYGRWISLEQLREECHVGRDGSNFNDIAQTATAHGMTVTGRAIELQHVAKLPFPAILHWGFDHFVVLEGVSHDRYYLNDPAEGYRAVGRETFDREFTGAVLELEPGPGFRRQGSRRGGLRMLWPLLEGHGSRLTRIAALGLLLALLSLVLPILLAVFVDGFLEGGRNDLGGALIAGMLAAGAGAYVLTWLQMRSLRELVVRLSTVQSDRFLDTLLRLPLRFFAHRLTGDLVMRMRMIDQVADTGAGQLVRIAVDLVMSVTFLVVMLVWNPPLALAVTGLGLSCFLLTRLLTRLRRDQNHRLRREQAMLAGQSAGGLKLIENLVATARENDFFSDWSGRQARELRARQAFTELGHVAASLPHLFQLLTAAAVFGFGGWLMMLGQVSIGTLMGFYVLAGNFIRPVARVAQFSDLLETLEADLTRMEDVLHAPRELARATNVQGAPRQVATLEGKLRLIGKLEVRGVTFGYQRSRPPLIDGLSLTIEPGQRIAVVGASGSGKSTLAQLIAGLYSPWSGDILFDGHMLEEIPREVFCRSVAIVDQQPVLFAASIRDNLTMWDATTPDDFVTAAARDAAIHEDIISRPAGYNSLVEEDGHNFSGGQRLRLEIARALVNNPSLLILDEATSALDPMTELLVDYGIRRRGCSCLIIAHRLSTIRDADRIFVVDKGRIVEHGTHDELRVRDSVYRGLIQGD